MADTAALLVWGALVWVVCALWPGHVPFLGPFVFNPVEFLGLWSALVWYVRGLVLMADRPSAVRIATALVGWGSIYFVLQTHFEYWAQHMFCLNRTTALVSGMFGPFLLSFGDVGRVLHAGAPRWALRATRAVTPLMLAISRPHTAYTV